MSDRSSGGALPRPPAQHDGGTVGYSPSADVDIVSWPADPEATAFGGTFDASDVGGEATADEMNSELRSFAYRHTLTLCVAGIFALGSVVFLLTRLIGGGVEIPLEYVNMVLTPLVLVPVFVVECLLHYRDAPTTPLSSRVRQAAAAVTVATFGLTFVRHPYNVYTCVADGEINSANATVAAAAREDRLKYCIEVVEPLVVAALATGLGVVHLYPTAIAPVVFWILGNYYAGRLLVPRAEDPESPMVFGLSMGILVVVALVCAGIAWIRHHATLRGFLASVELHRVSALRRKEQDQVDRLLATTLPDSVLMRIANAVALGGAAADAEIDDFASAASVLYADIANFTRWSSSRPPSQVVEMLQVLVCSFDTHSDMLGVEKVKTIGDCYWAVSGIPIANPVHADAVVYLAMCLVAITEAENASHPQWDNAVALRVGVHSGPVHGMLLGSDRLSYEPYGPTCDIAQATEAAGTPNRVCVTDATVTALKISKGPLAEMIEEVSHSSLKHGGAEYQLYFVKELTEDNVQRAQRRSGGPRAFEAAGEDEPQNDSFTERLPTAHAFPNTDAAVANDEMGNASVSSIEQPDSPLIEHRSATAGVGSPVFNTALRDLKPRRHKGGLLSAVSPAAASRMGDSRSPAGLSGAASGGGILSDDTASNVGGDREELRQRRLKFAEMRMQQARKKQAEIERTMAEANAGGLVSHEKSESRFVGARDLEDAVVDEAAELAKVGRRWHRYLPGMMAFADDETEGDYGLFALEQTRGLRLFTRAALIALLCVMFIIQAIEQTKIAIALYAVAGLGAVVSLVLCVFDLIPVVEHIVVHLAGLMTLLTLMFTEYSIVANSLAWCVSLMLLLVTYPTPRLPSLARALLFILLSIVAAIPLASAPVTANSATVLLLGAIFGALMVTSSEAQLRLEYQERIEAQRAGAKIFEAKEQQVALLSSMVPMHVIPALVRWTNTGMNPAEAVVNSIPEVAIAFLHFSPPDVSTAIQQQQRRRPSSSDDSTNANLATSGFGEAAVWLRNLHSRVDAVLAKCIAVEKVKTIGDLVMMGGPFTRSQLDFDATSVAVGDALYVAHALMAATAGDRTGIALGVHVGPVMAAVLGTQRLCFDVFGDTVNTASRVLSGLRKNLGNATSGAAVSSTVMGLLRRNKIMQEDAEVASFDQVHRRPGLECVGLGSAIETEAKGKGTLTLHRVRTKIMGAADGAAGSAPAATMGDL